MLSGRIASSSGRSPDRPKGSPIPLRRVAAPYLAAALIATALRMSVVTASAGEPVVMVTLDQAQIMPYPAHTATIIVGNPIIADVTMLKNSGQVILTGRGFGDTNLVFLDGQGAVLSETRLSVRESSAFLVVQRGMERETYACRPRCQPTVTLGDASTFLAKSAAEIQARNGLASGAAASAAALAQPR